MTTTCSADGCDAPAVLSWQRGGTADETRAHAEQQVAVQQRLTDARRDQLNTQIADLTGRLGQLEQGVPGMDPGTVRGLAEQTHARIDAVRNELAAIVDPQVPHALDPVAVLMFGCDRHAPDADAAAGLHEPDCSPPCTCTPAPVEPAADHPSDEGTG